ncbi:MAG: hypothetical protein ACREM3_12615 [Candidatus Rokuibacteriota bacterium]
MADATQQLFEMWRRQVEEGAQAWSRVMSGAQPPPPAAVDPTAFWKPLVDQWVQAWAAAFARTPMTPDVMPQWKQFVDQSIEVWSRALGQAMNSEAFAQMLGRYLDHWLAVSAPVRKANDETVEAALQTLNLASRTQLTAVARQIVELDERVERVEEALTAIMRRLDEVSRTLATPPPAAGDRG